ncbi:MAG TPA: hypothetical protein VIO33_06245 [Burkholderiaceae bacterium]
MERIAIFVNDAAHARHLLQPMLEGADAAHWVVVACPPTLTRHIGRWVSHAAREQWRERWAAELFEAIELELQARPGNKVERLLAKRPLVDVSKRLEARLGAIRLLDARRPRLGKPDEPISASQPPSDVGRWAVPVAATTGMTVMLALAD